jgi:hypothetical protein
MKNTKDLEIIAGMVFDRNDDIPPCNPENSCDVIQEFVGEEDGSYDQYLRIKRDCLREIGNIEDIIEAHASKIRDGVLYIKELKQEIDEAFNKYKSSWQQ